MEHKKIFLLLLCSSILVFSDPSLASGADKGEDELRSYIVIVHERPENVSNVDAWYKTLLSTAISNSSRLIYSYNNVVNGFAARLSRKEVQALSKQNWFVDAHLSREYKLATTRTPSFLGLRQSKNHLGGLWNISKMGEGMIIGLLDSGIAAGHRSFNDEGMPPPPAKWKGHCDFNKTVCNNKLIGAIQLDKGREHGHLPPVDLEGHGSHTASTAAGAIVKNAIAFGNNFGLASGMAPRAHIAMYHTCVDTCMGVDILKAIEVAVNDGVDVLSLSIGESLPTPDSIKFGPFGMSQDIIIGAFYAISHGVVVSASADNTGPAPGTVANDAPWILTVGASTTDRRIASVVRLRNGMVLSGETLNQPKIWSRSWMPLIHFNASVPISSARGSIVIARMKDLTIAHITVDDLTNIAPGATAYIVINFHEKGRQFSCTPYSQNVVEITYDDGEKLLTYAASHLKALAKIDFEGAVLKEPNSPQVATFSSRGPSVNFQGILKPDIIGPGVNILGAYPFEIPGFAETEFFFMSGTSMSAPHLSGIAALIKKVHPNWTAAAIKSAIMTTAYATRKGKPITDYTQLPADYLTMGVGHVDPRKAMNPGLVYDQKPEDYIPYLCGMGFKDPLIRTVVFPLRFTTCLHVKKISQEHLNYPSIRIDFKANLTTSKIIRTVTNVGDAFSTYRAKIEVSKGVYATVRPRKLHFRNMNQRKRFTITFRKIGNIQEPAQGQLWWISKKHVVRSPITISTELNSDYNSMKCSNYGDCNNAHP